MGCTAEERSMLQEVEFDIRVKFAADPVGCRTDRLEDTVCYSDLSDAVTEVAGSRPFLLVESLAAEAFNALKESIGPGHLIRVSVHKLRPPIHNLRGGVVFHFGDELP